MEIERRMWFVNGFNTFTFPVSGERIFRTFSLSRTSCLTVRCFIFFSESIVLVYI